MLILFLALCLFGATVQGQQQQGWPFSKQPFNIRAQVLILDVGSLSFQGNHPIAPPFAEEGCADACARTPGCNAWTYCSKKEGCGSGCKAYTDKNPQLRPGDNPTIANPAWKTLPTITAFGPWGLTAGCKTECGSEWPCKTTDVWPYGMCTLKKLANPDKPELWSTNAGEGWVSGFTKQPPECAGAGLSVRTCTRCIRSKDPAGCLKCASQTAFKLSMLEGAMSVSLAKADGCSACVNSADPAKCVDCLTSNAPCADCALQQPAADGTTTMDVSACVSCTRKHGETFKAACTSCALLGAKPQSLGQCMSCLQAMKPLASTSSEYMSGFYNPTLAPSACATCATRAQSFGTCMACLQSSPYSANCESCAGIQDASKQAACYKCSKESGHAGSGCSDCLSYLSDPAQQQQCMGCLTNLKLGKEGKQWCFGCQNWCNTFDTRAKCVACLGTPQTAYGTACGCSN